MLNILDQDIQYMPGIGPRKKALLSSELGIATLRDLLEYYPYKYVDRSRIYTVRDKKRHAVRPDKRADTQFRGV